MTADDLHLISHNKFIKGIQIKIDKNAKKFYVLSQNEYPSQLLPHDMSTALSMTSAELKALPSGVAGEAEGAACQAFGYKNKTKTRIFGVLLYFIKKIFLKCLYLD